MKITVWHHFDLQCLAKEEFFLHCIYTFNTMNIFKGINIDVTLDRYYYIKKIIKYVKYIKNIYIERFKLYVNTIFFIAYIIILIYLQNIVDSTSYNRKRV